MPTDLPTAYDEIIALFLATWSAEPTAPTDIHYDDRETPLPLPESAQEWVKFSVSQGPSVQIGLGSVNGKKLWGTEGIILIEIRTLSNDGLERAQFLGPLAMGAFRGKQTAGGVWFKNISSKPGGADGPWTVTIVTADFSFTERK